MAEQTGYAVAPIGRRAAAWLLDVVLGSMLVAGFVLAVGGMTDAEAIGHLVALKSATGRTGHALSAAMNLNAPDPGALKPILGILACFTVIAIASVAYRVVTTAVWGAGVGKALLGLRVVVDEADGAESRTPGWARSWRRWVVPQVPGLIPLPATGLLAYLPAFKDARRRGLHDRAAGTIVVDLRAPRRAADPAPRVPAVATDEYYVRVTPEEFAARIPR